MTNHHANKINHQSIMLMLFLTKNVSYNFEVLFRSRAVLIFFDIKVYEAYNRAPTQVIMLLQCSQENKSLFNLTSSSNKRTFLLLKKKNDIASLMYSEISLLFYLGHLVLLNIPLES